MEKHKHKKEKRKASDNYVFERINLIL